MINVTLILIANSYGITPIQDGDRVVKESHVMMCPEESYRFYDSINSMIKFMIRLLKKNHYTGILKICLLYSTALDHKIAAFLE